MPRGRHQSRVMTPAVQEEVLQRISGGETVPAICADPRMPSKSTVFRFLAGSSDESVKFRTRYDSVVRCRAYSLVELALAIADDSSRDWEERRNENGEVYYVVSREQVVRDRHRIRLMHRTAARLLPSVFGLGKAYPDTEAR
jgi:hypothetical protein